MRTPLRQIFVESCIRGFANGLRHLDHGRKRTQVDAGAHAVRAPEFNIISIVMRLKQPSLVIGVPGADAVVQTALYQRIHLLEPAGVSGDMPVAVNFHDSAQLAVGSSGSLVIHRASWAES